MRRWSFSAEASVPRAGPGLRCEDEANRRAAAAVSRRLKAARFGERVSLEDFNLTVSAKLPVATIRDLPTLRSLDRGESVVLHGPVGVG